jgi:hypothetical protein
VIGFITADSGTVEPVALDLDGAMLAKAFSGRARC